MPDTLDMPDIDDEDLPASGTRSLLSARLTREILDTARTLTMAQIRGLVDTYYQIQDYRKAAANQQRAAQQGVDTNPAVRYVYDQLLALEHDIRRLMDRATDAHVPSRWAKSLIGVGPVISAGFLAHLDVTRARTPSSFWEFAGLNPEREWLGTEKARTAVKEHLPSRGEIPEAALDELADTLKLPRVRVRKMVLDPKTGKPSRTALEKALARRPWNAKLKVLQWKLTASMVKVQGNKKAPIYCQLYLERKAKEVEANERGTYEQVAKETLAKKRFNPETEAYKAYTQGELPKGQLDLRARRYAAKVFLVHLFQVMYSTHYKTEPPKPYILEKEPERHTRVVPIPNWPMQEES